MAVTDVGTGTTIAFSTATYAAEILGLSASGIEVPIIDITHMGSTTSRRKLPGDLRDEGSIDVEIHFDPDLGMPPLGTSQTITITTPIAPSKASGASIAGTGCLSSFNYSIPLEDKMIGGYTLTWLNVVTFTASTS